MLSPTPTSRLKNIKTTLVQLLTIFFIAGLEIPTTAQEVDFNNDIRPILADTCYKCHGPDGSERKADLRLDTKAGIVDDSGSVVPGQLDDSELYHRVISDDPDTLMPPADSGRVLSLKQKDLLKRWIEQGAKWQNHWSLEKPVKHRLPVNVDKSWPLNPIDNFILDRLERENLSPSPTANRATLIRRVTFDLTGLPPQRETVQKFIESSDTDWYEQLVDELLASPRYGEHLARYWLDAARYGDTHGLHLDNYREMWPYRDWVINALNRNLSFRDFTIEQLAGDLLDNPTIDQQVASGFNRAHITTNEGGAIMDEVYVRNVVDRVSTTGTIFMGMTVGCAQCHDHKFDPISQKEFYQMFAFFNNLKDPPIFKNAKDLAAVMMVIKEEEKQRLANLELALAKAVADMDKITTDYIYRDPYDHEPLVSEVTPKEAAKVEPKEYVWIDDAPLPIGAKKEQKWIFINQEVGPVHTGETSRLQVSELGMVQHFFTGATTPLKTQAGDKLFAYVFLDPSNPPEQLMLQFNDGDWNHRAYWGKNNIDWGKDHSPSRFFMGPLPEFGKWIRLEVEAEKVGLAQPSLLNGMAFTQHGGKAHWDSAGIVSKTSQTTEFKSFKKWLAIARQGNGTTLPDEIKKLVNRPKDKLRATEMDKIRAYFLSKVHPESVALFTEPQKKIDDTKKALDDFNRKLPTTLISKESPEIKAAFVLSRGEYDQKTFEVERETPAALPPFPDDLPKNRLGFAKWLTTPDHPLTSRVTVNRYWQQLFGTGLVKTSEDLGSQGEMPSHPELLDWLAVDFVENDWDVKRILKLMVMSRTYQQSSILTSELAEKDPKNRLYARGPRFRLDAEMLRDQALSVSNLLVTKMGGPGVKPPQPSGLWFAVGYSGSNTVRFKKDSGGEKVHRRSIYTFWKRTAPPPQMNIFDAPSREECRVRRERTNTPLQALLLMNDPQYVEAARYFAERTLVSNRQSDREKLQFVFEIALARSPTQTEVKIILADLVQHRTEFGKNPDAAKMLIAIGEVGAKTTFSATELASWTMITSLVMNMDEFVTRN